MSTVVEHDIRTGKTVERPMTQPELDQAERDRLTAEQQAADEAAAPDPDAALVAAISSATTLQQLKDALIGTGRPSAVRGRPTDNA